MAGRDELSLKPDARSALSDLRGRLDGLLRVVDFRVYGSTARGTALGDSDIDVMIEVADPNPGNIAQIDDIVYEVNLAHDTFISTVVFTSDELNSGPLSESPLYKNIMREGIRF